MDVLEDQVRRVLAKQVQDVNPQLRGADLRALAAASHGRHARISGQLSAAAAVVAIAVMPFLLRHESPTPAQPAAPVTVVTNPAPAPAPPRPRSSLTPSVPITVPRPVRTTGTIDSRPARSSEVPTSAPARPSNEPIRSSSGATRTS